MPNALREGSYADDWTPSTKYKQTPRFSKGDPQGLNGEDFYHLFLTAFEQSLGCKCIEPILASYIRLDLSNRSIPFGSYCAKCLLPKWTSIFSVLRYCEGCNKKFVLRAKIESFTKVVDLCYPCATKVPVRKRNAKVTSVKVRINK